MTSASLSGVRMLPLSLGNKGEPPPTWPPTEEGPRLSGGGWPREAVECGALSAAWGTWGRHEGGLPNQLIHFSLSHYVTLG